MGFTLGFLFLAFASAGQLSTPAEKLNSRFLLQQGQLVSLRLEMGKPLKIFIVGKEQGKLDLKSFQLQVKSLSPYPGEELQVDPHGDYYSLPQTLKETRPAELAITVKTKGQSETLIFKLDHQGRKN